MYKFKQTFPDNSGVKSIVISDEQRSAIDKEMMTVNDEIRYDNAVAALNAQRICINR
jgi:hypothetical protein